MNCRYQFRRKSTCAVASIIIFYFFVPSIENLGLARPKCRGTITFGQLGDYGRLGNQLFQAATTIALAKAHSLCWAFPSRVIDRDIGQLFASFYGTLDDEFIKDMDVIAESQPNYYSVPLDLDEQEYPPSLSLHGYFQSPLYFSKIDKDIRTIFMIRQSHVQTVETALAEIDLSTAVGLHVRRGDYLDDAFNHIYSLPGVKYYRQGLEIISSREEISTVVVVSDDIKWCKKNLNLTYNVIFSPFNDTVFDFTLLHLCKHLVIPNSSFSWWAAFLSQHAGKGLVVAPTPWYKTDGPLAQANTPEIYLKGWHVLSVD